MNVPSTVTALLDRPGVLIGALIMSLLVLAWLAQRVRRVARSVRPDEKLTNLAMLIGFGWSSEAVWALTGRMGWGWEIRIPLFAIMEMLLSIAMIRTRRNIKLHGRPGNAGQSAWLIAAGMSIVAAASSGSLPEAALRLLIPLFVTKTWWDGIAGTGIKGTVGMSTWRWTPRRLLLAVGAIEPGENDVETVHRERLTQQMVRLEFRRLYGPEKHRERVARKLSWLSAQKADDDILTEVQRRVSRANWFETAPAGEPAEQPKPTMTAGRAASARAARVRHGRTVRVLRVTHPTRVVSAAPEPVTDPRETQEIDLVVDAIKTAHPALSQRRVAHLAGISEPAVRRAVRRIRSGEPTHPSRTNGKIPALAGAAT